MSGRVTGVHGGVNESISVQLADGTSLDKEIQKCKVATNFYITRTFDGTSFHRYLENIHD